MMKTILKRASFIGFILVIAPAVSQAVSFKVGYDSECYVKNDGRYDEHWFCGNQAQSCRKNKVNGKDMPHWQYHGDSFTYDNNISLLIILNYLRETFNLKFSFICLEV